MKILIAGGGTGGHLTPAIALIEEIDKKSQPIEILIARTGREIEKKFIETIQTRNVKISNSTIEIKTIRKKEGFISIVKSFIKAQKIIKDFSPDIILGFGGYVSGPIILMGKIMRKKTAIFEYNSVAGLTNKILSKIVDYVFVAFENTKGIKKSKKVIKVSVPIREKFKRDFEKGINEKGKNGIVMSVFGGSQGAKGLNNLVLQAVKIIRPEIKIFHQAGKDYESVKVEYEKNNIKAEVFEFTNKPGFFFGISDFLITRAGAGTIFEIIYSKKPSILVPFPYATEDHQFYNALILKNSAFIVRENEKEKFLDAFQKILNKDVRKKLAENFPHIEGENLVDIILNLPKL